jgi:hypothetical protein
MTRSQLIVLLISTMSTGFVAVGCKSGGVGDPCIPEDEYSGKFSGFGVAEANVESRSFQCETRVCIANHFQGRVSCAYGQTITAGVRAPENERGATPGPCYIPSSDNTPVDVSVAAQLTDRRAENTVYCSCRCEGADKTANYCTCPSGYSCLPLVPDLGFGRAQLAGKYCLKNGSEYTGRSVSSECSWAKKDCPSDRATQPNLNAPP